MKKQINKILILSAIIFPAISFAALDGVKGILTSAKDFMNPLISVMFGLALIYFFWGLGQFILKAGDEKLREQGKKKILWGIVALFVFISIFGIINWIGNTIGISAGGSGNTTNCNVSESWLIPGC